MRNNKGLVMVNTGPGKGKTTAALGTALRAAGRGLKVMILQFIKGRETGEFKSIELLPNVEYRQFGRGMIRSRSDTSVDEELARNAWKECQTAVLSKKYDLVILDEICLALHYGFLNTSEVVAFLRAKPEQVHIIITGRYCPPEVLAVADTVTQMEMVKHHYSNGVKAIPGIEY